MERIVFFGTPDFAVPTLAALCEGDRRPVLVVTQPARPGGRGRQLRQPPVAEWASAAGLPVSQPESVRSAQFVGRLVELAPTLAVVVAFGQIFPKSLLDLPTGGCINVHASLLPLYRGAAPIQAAIIAGDRVTGITTMQMDEGLDTGAILLQEEVPIGAEETAGELSSRMAQVGARLLVTTLDRRAEGRLEARIQDHARATVAPRIRRRDGIIDWSLGARRLFNRLRGLTPWPGLSTSYRGETVKILWWGLFQ